MKKAVLTSEGKDFFVQTSCGNKLYRFEWNAKNNFTCSLPLRLEYYDPYKEKIVVTQYNYPQFLLDSYPGILRLIEVVEEPDITSATSETPTEEPKQRGRRPKKKGEEDESTAVAVE